MSHRRALTDADRTVDSILKHIPEIRSLPDGEYGILDDKTRSFLNDVNDSHGHRQAMDAGYYRYSVSRGNDKNFLIPEEIALWSRWRTCRHVFRFDKSLSAELNATKLPDDMPIEAIERLPYPIIYVEAPIPLCTFSGKPIEVKGFFAWRDKCIDTTSWEDHDALVVSYVTPGFGRDMTTGIFDVSFGTLGELVEDSMAGDLRHAEMMRRSGVETRIADDYAEKARAPIVSVLNHLLYVVSDGSEQKVTYRPSGNARRATKTSPSTIHEVGTRIGRALGRARVVYESQGQMVGTGRSPRAHMRAGHWHHHWTGPKSDPRKRKLVLRWHDPVMVNAGAHEAASATTIHPVLRG